MDTNQVIDTLKGGFGIAAVEAVQHTEIPTAGQAETIIKIVVQVIIGVATLIGLFKRRQKQ